MVAVAHLATNFEGRAVTRVERTRGDQTYDFSSRTVPCDPQCAACAACRVIGGRTTTCKVRMPAGAAGAHFSLINTNTQRVHGQSGCSLPTESASARSTPATTPLKPGSPHPSHPHAPSTADIVSRWMRHTLLLRRRRAATSVPRINLSSAQRAAVEDEPAAAAAAPAAAGSSGFGFIESLSWQRGTSAHEAW